MDPFSRDHDCDGQRGDQKEGGSRQRVGHECAKYGSSYESSSAGRALLSESMGPAVFPPFLIVSIVARERRGLSHFYFIALIFEGRREDEESSWTAAVALLQHQALDRRTRWVEND